jgi:O-antigen/teichoic acid export membrane protein
VEHPLTTPESVAVPAGGGAGWAQQLVRQGGYTLGVMATNVLLAFGINVLLARLLGVRGYGYYAYLTVWLTVMVNVGLLGVDRLLVRDWAVYRSLGDWAHMGGLWRWANLAVLAATVGVAAAGWLAASSLRARLDTEQIATLHIGLLALPFMALTLVRQAALQAEGHSLAGQIPERILRPVVVGAVSVLLFWGMGEALAAPAAAAAFVAASALAFGVSEVLVIRLRPAVPIQRLAIEGRRWVSSSVRLMASTLLAIVGEQTGLLLVGVYAGAAAVGVYSVGLNGSRLVALGLLAVNVPLAPIVARLHASGDPAAVADLVRRSRRAVLAVTAALFLSMVLLQNVFLGLFGPEFTAARLPLLILCVGQLLNGACGPVALLLAMTHHEREVVAAMALNLVISLVFGLWLIPAWGELGAAVAATVALAAWNLFLVQRVARHLGLNLLTTW